MSTKGRVVGRILHTEDIPVDCTGAVRIHDGLKRTMAEAAKAHRACGCGRVATHVGMAGGTAMILGCEWSVRRWVHNPGCPMCSDPETLGGPDA